MAVSYRVDPTLKCVFVTLHDTVTDEEVLEAQRDLFRDELFEGQYPRLVTATAVTSFLVAADTVRSVANSAIDRGMRKAALVANADFIYGMMRMYEGYAFDAECEVFRDADAAAGWLFSDNA